MRQEADPNFKKKIKEKSIVPSAPRSAPGSGSYRSNPVESKGDSSEPNRSMEPEYETESCDGAPWCTVVVHRDWEGAYHMDGPDGNILTLHDPI